MLFFASCPFFSFSETGHLDDVGHAHRISLSAMNKARALSACTPTRPTAENLSIFPLLSARPEAPQSTSSPSYLAFLTDAHHFHALSCSAGASSDASEAQDLEAHSAKLTAQLSQLSSLLSPSGAINMQAYGATAFVPLMKVSRCLVHFILCVMALTNQT